MAAYYPYVVALLLIYSYSTNASPSIYNGSKTTVKDHLREETQTSSSQQSSDLVCDLSELDKLQLCNEIVRHMIREEKRDTLDMLLGVAVLVTEPQIAAPFTLKCKDIQIEEFDMVEPMLWCRPKLYRKKVPGSDSNPLHSLGHVDGFFCASSSANKDRVYVFRTEDEKAQKVQPVAELNNYKLQ